MATMNRGAVIGETLASLAAQGELGDVELIVIDGSADALTEQAIATWRDRLPAVHYERCAPRGFDRDYCAAVAKARGDYCWLISDDDLLLPGALAKVREAIAGGPDFVVANTEVRDPEMHELLVASGLPLAEDREFGPGEDDAMAMVALSFLSYVGGVVVRRELWCARDAKPYWGTDFVHVGVLFQRPIERSVFVVARPLIGMRFGVSLWTNRFFDIWMFQWPDLVWSFPQVSQATKQSVVWREPWRRCRQLLLLRATNHYSLRHFRQRLSGRTLGLKLRCVAWLAAITPVSWAARGTRWYLQRVGRYTGRARWELEAVLNRGGS